MKLRNLLIATIALMGGCLCFESNAEDSPKNINLTRKNASSDVTFTYTFPADWQTKLKTISSWGGTDVGWVANNFTNLDATIATRIDFYDSSVNLGKEWSTAYNSYMFDLVYYTVGSTSAPVDTIMCVVSNPVSAYSSVRRISFYATDSRTVIVPYNFPLFYNTAATTFVFDNFKFTDKTQYDFVMNGSKATNVSGDDVAFLKSYDMADWKSALDSITGSTDYYKKVTYIQFVNSAPSGYTNTGYTVGGVPLYRNGTEIAFVGTMIKAPTDMSSMFANCTSLKSINFNTLDTANTTNFSNLLSGCTSLTDANLSILNLSNSSLTQSGVDGMLSGDTAITTVIAPNLMNSGLSIALPSTYYDMTNKADITAITSDNATHTLKLHTPHSKYMWKYDAVASTCEKQGNSEYYKCVICEKYFSDQAGTQELDGIPYLPKLEHDIQEAVTLSEDEKTATIALTCKNDNASLGTVTSTDITEEVEAEPTCDAKGTKKYTIKYEYDGKERTVVYTEDIDALGHKYTYTTNLSENKTTATIDVRCENEGDVVKETINASSVTKNVTKEATHFEKGSVEYTITYEYDGKTYTDTITEEIPVLTGKLAYECVLADDKTSGQIRVVKEDGSSELVDATVVSVIEKDSTCSQLGRKVYTFTGTFEGHEITQTMEEDIPLKDHDLEYVVSMVDEDHANVAQTCKNEDGKVIKEETGLAITSTEQDDGSTKYTVSIDGGTNTLDITDKVLAYKKNKAKEDDLSSIRTEYAKYALDDVNSSEKTAIESLISDIDSVASKHASLLTEEEKTELADKKTKLDECLTRIDSVATDMASLLSANTDKTTTNVTSSDKAGLTSTKTGIEELLNGNNLTTDERTSLEEKKSQIESLLSKVEDVSNAIASIDRYMEGKDESNVKSSDKTDLEQNISKIDELLASSNLTDEERTSLTSTKDDIDKLISKIDSVKDGITSIISSDTGKTTSNVTSADKSDLENMQSSIQSLLDDSNLTDEERASLTERKSEVDSLLGKIEEVSNTIDEIDSSMEGKNESNVKSSDKAEIQESIEKADELLDGENLTSEERTTLTTKKAQLRSYANKIDETQKEYDDVKNSLDSIDSSDESEENINKITETIEKAETLASSSNLTEEEKTSLNELIRQSKNILAGMKKSTTPNLWWLIITLSCIMLLEVGAIVFIRLWDKKKKKEAAEVKASSFTLLPLVALASTPYPVGQIVACVLLGIGIVGLLVYLVYLVAKTGKRKGKKPEGNNSNTVQ